MKCKILVKKVNGLVLPVKANPDDAGDDVVAVSEPIIVGTKFERPLDGIKAWAKIDYIEYKTNLFFAPQLFKKGKQEIQFHLEGFGRSSLSKKNLVLANSVATLDNGYRGEVSFRFKYIFQPEDFILVPESGRTRIYAVLNPENVYQKGDRIAQLKARADIKTEYVPIEELNETQRGSGGFGSTN